jgi:hypothetical protein
VEVEKLCFVAERGLPALFVGAARRELILRLHLRTSAFIVNRFFAILEYEGGPSRKTE